MDEEYKQSDISKEVERLMDEEGFTFGEAVKQAMAEGYKDGGLMIAIQRFAQGGGVGSLMQPRINFKGGGASHSKSSSKSKSSSNQGPAGGASAGGNYGGNKNPNQTYGGGGGGNNNNGGGGGNNNTTTKPNPGSGRVTKVKRVAKPSFFNKLNTHFLNNQKLKNAVKAGEITVDDYNVLGGYDAKQTLGLSPLATALTSGAYNLVQSALGPKFSGANQPLFDGALDIGKNTFGSTLNPDSAYATQYDQIMNTYKDGGGVGSLMQPKRQGLFMGGSPLSGEALAIYNSMNSYGYTDQDIADKLLSLNLYTPPGTTPPPGTPPPGTTPPGGNNGGNGGGDGGAGTTTKTTTTDPNTFNADTFDDATIIDKYVYDRPYSMKDVAGDGLTTTTTSKNAFEETAPTTSVLEEIISSNKPTMANIAGDDLPVNFDSEILNNPNLDPKVPSIEAGSAGFAKPTIANVAGKELAGTTAPSIEKAISTFSGPTMADVANDLEKGPITMENIGAPDIPSDYDNFGQFGFGNFAEFGPQTIDDLSNIGMAKDPDVEDPYGGKYTPSFEEKKAAEGLVADLVNKIKSSSYNPMQLDNILTSFTSRGIFDLAGINNPYGLLSSAAGLGYNYFKKKLSKNKAAAAAAAAQNQQEIKDLQEKIDKGGFNTSKDDRVRSTVTKESAAKSKGVGAGGYTKSDDNRESRRGNTGSTKSSSKSSGTKSGGAGKGGGADSGGSKGGSKGGTSSTDSSKGNLGFSDIRLKDNIELVGKSNLDINIYNFTYLNDPTVYQGVMAHEVPWASIKHDSGYLMVDYNKVDVDFKIIN